MDKETGYKVSEGFKYRLPFTCFFFYKLDDHIEYILNNTCPIAHPVVLDDNFLGLIIEVFFNIYDLLLYTRNLILFYFIHRYFIHSWMTQVRLLENNVSMKGIRLTHPWRLQLLN